MRVATVGIYKEDKEGWYAKIRAFGAHVHEKRKVSQRDRVTHLVCLTAKKANKSLTVKDAVNLGIPIVTIDWIDSLHNKFAAHGPLTKQLIDEVTREHQIFPTPTDPPVQTNTPTPTPTPTHPAPAVIEPSIEEPYIAPKARPFVVSNIPLIDVSFNPLKPGFGKLVNIGNQPGSTTMDPSMAAVILRFSFSHKISLTPDSHTVTPTLSDDQIAFHFPTTSPTVIRTLLTPNASVSHIALLSSTKTTSTSLPTTTTPTFTSPHHLHHCLSKYHTLLTLKIEHSNTPYTCTHHRAFNAFVTETMERLDARDADFGNVSKWVGMHLQLSLMDPWYDFSLPDARLHQGILDAVLSTVSCARELSNVLACREIITLLRTGPPELVDTLARIVIGLCVSLESVWENSDLCELFESVVKVGMDSLNEAVMFGIEAETTGLLRLLVSTPSVGSETEFLETVYAVLDALVRLETGARRVGVVLMESPSLLLTALRCGSRPMVLYLTQEMNVPMSRLDPATGVECPWALLETVRTGSWGLVQSVVGDGEELGRVFSRNEGNGGVEFLTRLETAWMGKRKGLNERAPWGLRIHSMSAVVASFGNEDVFGRVVKALDASHLARVPFCVEVEWMKGSGCFETFTHLGPLDLALLGGFLPEATRILQILVTDSSTTTPDPLYTPTILLSFLVWMISIHPEPTPPSLHPSATLLSPPSPSSTLLQNLLSLLSETHWDPLVSNAPWPQSLPYDLYAHTWTSASQTTHFFDSDRFLPPTPPTPPTRPKPKRKRRPTPSEQLCLLTTPFLCWAAARFDIELIVKYLPYVSTNPSILRSHTPTHNGDTWLHLLAKGFTEVKNSRGYTHIVVSFIEVPEVFLAVDSRGRSVKECGEEGLVVGGGNGSDRMVGERVLGVIRGRVGEAEVEVERRKKGEYFFWEEGSISSVLNDSFFLVANAQLRVENVSGEVVNVAKSGRIVSSKKFELLY
ncbi:hypothetical protein HDU98_010026 [Podochytrium sp. JEL0797]|nr:hypothetical protein HDU98_010026 [Podochytrium sp. JEL0797]